MVGFDSETLVTEERTILGTSLEGLDAMWDETRAPVPVEVLRIELLVSTLDPLVYIDSWILVEINFVD